MTNSATDRGTHTQKKAKHKDKPHERRRDEEEKGNCPKTQDYNQHWLSARPVFLVGILVQMCGKQEANRKEEVVMI